MLVGARAEDTGARVPASRSRSRSLAGGARRRRVLVHTRSRWRLRSSPASALVALPFAVWRGAGPLPPGSLFVIALGAAFGVALWQVAAPIEGDALFHLARVRKLWAFDELSLERLGEFRDGGLHPGYAFPLWHGFLALVAKLAGVDPTLVVLHEASVLAPLAFAVVYEAGMALFRSRSISFALVLAQAALIGLAPGKGGAYAFLALPGTASRQLLVPAVLALVFAHLLAPAAGVAGRDRGRRARACDRPPDVRGLPLPAARRLPRRARAALARRPQAARRGAAWRSAVPSAAVALAIVPLVRATASHTPTGGELRRAFTHYAGQIDVFSETSYRLAPEVFGRSGAVAVAALLLDPARRARLAAPLGGVRPRRLDRGLRGHARALPLPALRRRRLALAGAARGRVRPARVRVRRRARRPRGGLQRRGPAARVLPPGCCCRPPTPATSATRSRAAGPRSRAGSPRSAARPRSSRRRSSAALVEPLERQRADHGAAAALFVAPVAAHAAPTGRRARPDGPRSRPASCRRSTATCPRAPRSSPTSRRATGSRRTRRSTSPPRRRATSPTPTRTGPTRGAATSSSSSAPATTTSRPATAPAGSS